ncbi:YciI family protein [Deminuibacter soli]|nr:YciI family protein [Deminuibacter soli]
MFLLELTYKVSQAEVDERMPAHAAYLNASHDRGEVIFAGYKSPRTGGLIVANFNDKTAVECFVHKDPFYLGHVADYRIVEFSPQLGKELFGAAVQA